MAWDRGSSGFMQLFFFLRFLLAVSFATSRNFDDLALPTASQSLHVLNSTIFNNGSLGASHNPPWGPDDFEVDFDHSSQILAPENSFMLALQLLASQAPLSWEGYLPDARMVARDSAWPDVAIAIASTGPDDRMLRKYFFWGMARAMNHFVIDEIFKSTTYTFRWQGEIVGRIFFIRESPRSRRQLGAEYKEILPLPVNTTVGATSSNNEITLTYNFRGDRLKMSVIFMGTYGSLISLAESRPEFGEFFGRFPPYAAVVIWVPTRQTTRSLSRAVLIECIVKAATESMSRRDFRELRAEASFNGRLFANGGWIGHLPELEAAWASP